MREVEPEVFMIAQPQFGWEQVDQYLKRVGGEVWMERIQSEPVCPSRGELLTEFAGRLCYRAWAPGLNPNVTKVHEDSGEYLRNIIESRHGSVLEHGWYVFVFHNVSRVFTHELVRHRVGTSISQESLRYVRLDDLPFWCPEWARDDHELMSRNRQLLTLMEEHQRWMADHFKLDETKPCVCGGVALPCTRCGGTGKVPAVPFSVKKAKTSFMRRFAPEGVATGIVWGANLRTLRHAIELRTDTAAEEEMRFVFSKLADTIMRECPNVFADYQRTTDPAGDVYATEHRKV